MVEAIIQGFINVFSLGCFAGILGGVIIGLIVGVLPGLGGAGALAILIPVIYGRDPVLALAFLVALHSVIYQGGLITSILFGIPGETASTATIVDGYPMAQQGKAGRALGNGFMASMLGGIFGGLVLAAFLPIAQPIVLAFGSPEYFMLSIMGISFVAVLGGGSMIKALIAGALGLLLAFVGFHQGTGQLRYTMGSLYFYGGLNVVPVFIGLFAMPEVFEMMVGHGSIAKVEKRLIPMADVVQGIKDVFRHWWLVLRCSAIGTMIGIIPGLGGAVATWMCYGHAKQTSKRASEFGHGCEEGVIAPESANNAKEGGSLLPTLAFGIPGSTAMVLILGALMVVGVEPGPGMMTKHLDLLWTIVITLIVANIIGSGIGILCARDLARITFVRGTILAPVIILFVIMGAYCVANNPWDVLLAFVFGGIGYLMKVYDYSRVTFTIGFVLGDYAERYLLISLAGLGPGFLFVSPIATCLLIATILGFASSGIKRIVKRLIVK
jgi:putative tricarboxylic transport membrane protein